ncbi:MAG: HAMP domain-containing histidine kinase [Spirochaetales bacterium]|nr:HAMP domain-containing histidine kinase [Spirochaetales bacterium]
MKLRTSVFIVSFTVSATLLGGFIAASWLINRDATTKVDLAELELAVVELSAMARDAATGAYPAPSRMSSALVPIRRDVARRIVLERDRAVDTAVAWIAFLGIEAVAALVVSAAAARLITARWTRLRDGVLRLKRGEIVTRFSSGIRDEFGDVEAELDELVEALADRDRMHAEVSALQGWGEASAFLAHQARTPLASLSLSAQTARTALVDSELESSADVVAALGRVESEALRLTTLFGKIRSMSGFKDPVLTDVDPEDAIHEAAAALSARGVPVPASSIRVERSGSENRPRFDRDYLVEAFLNLLANSAEACAARNTSFGVTISLESSPGRYVVRYVDTVTGLDESLTSLVGQARYSTKADGMGLGVWLTGRIAALHGGRLEISRTSVGGLSFTMVFPGKGGT